MKHKSHSQKLDEAIAALQLKQDEELQLLKNQFHKTYESLNPLNIIKNTFEDLTHSSGIKNNLVNSLIGITTGYLSRKVLIGSSSNPIKNIFGALFQSSVSAIVARNANQIKALSSHLLNKV
jgi:hypothetical protein